MIDSIHNFLQTQFDVGQPWHAEKIRKVIEWRNQAQNEGIGEIIGRRIACGFALLGLSIIGVIDAIASVALAILTLPFLAADNDLPLDLFERARDGIEVSGRAMTFGFVLNCVLDELS